MIKKKLYNTKFKSSNFFRLKPSPMSYGNFKPSLVQFGPVVSEEIGNKQTDIDFVYYSKMDGHWRGGKICSVPKYRFDQPISALHVISII